MLLPCLVDNLGGIDHEAVVGEKVYIDSLFNPCLEKRILLHLSLLRESLPLIGIFLLRVKLYLKCRILRDGVRFCQFKVRYIS